MSLVKNVASKRAPLAWRIAHLTINHHDWACRDGLSCMVDMLKLVVVQCLSGGRLLAVVSHLLLNLKNGICTFEFNISSIIRDLTSNRAWLWSDCGHSRPSQIPLLTFSQNRPALRSVGFFCLQLLSTSLKMLTRTRLIQDCLLTRDQAVLTIGFVFLLIISVEYPVVDWRFSVSESQAWDQGSENSSFRSWQTAFVRSLQATRGPSTYNPTQYGSCGRGPREGTSAPVFKKCSPADAG
jgi:hypothetical protein